MFTQLFLEHFWAMWWLVVILGVLFVVAVSNIASAIGKRR